MPFCWGLDLHDVIEPGVPDASVDTIYDDDGGSSRGAMYVLLLNAEGTVKSEQKISSTADGLVDTLDFGDGDGAPDALVGVFCGDGGGNRGAAYVLLLNVDGLQSGAEDLTHSRGSRGALG